MQLQAAITIPVMDGRNFPPQSRDMLTHDEIRDEMFRQIDAKIYSQADIAKLLGIAPARMTEMRKGTRQLQQDEMPKVAEFLGMTERRSKLSAVEATHRIRNWGAVAQGAWLEQSEGMPEAYVEYDRLRGDPPPDDLFAVTPVGTSMNQRFPEGTQLICRKVPFGSGTYYPGDFVIVERTKHDLVELTVKRLERDDSGAYWLHSESDDERFKEPWKIGKPRGDHFTDLEVRVLGRVVRAVQDYERR